MYSKMSEPMSSWQTYLISILLIIVQLVVLICLPTVLSAQELNESDLLEKVALQQSGLSGLGLTVIDGQPYFRTQAQPDIPLPGKFGVGLDVVLLIGQNQDEEVSILAEDGEQWNNLNTFMRAVRYLRYGQPSDSLYARYGELDLVTIGHGFIMSGYSNHDRRGLRSNLGLANKKLGLETVLNNLAEPSIFGGRLYARPLQTADSSAFWRKLEVGLTYLTDIDPIPDIEDKTEVEEKSVADAPLVAAVVDENTEKPLQAIGADIGIPIFENKLIRTDIYSDIALLNMKQQADGRRKFGEQASGYAAGIRFLLPRTIFKTEYRIFTEGFVPTIFDYTYEALKGQALDPAGPNPPDFEGKEEEVKGQALRGFYSMLLFQPLKNVSLLGTIENYSRTEPKMYLGVTEDGLIPKLSFRVFYTKSKIGQPYIDIKTGKKEDPSFIEDLIRLDEKSAFIMKVGYEILEIPGGYPVEISIMREISFRPDEDGIYRTAKKNSFEIGIKHAVE